MVLDDDGDCLLYDGHAHRLSIKIILIITAMHLIFIFTIYVLLVRIDLALIPAYETLLGFSRGPLVTAGTQMVM